MTCSSLWESIFQRKEVYKAAYAASEGKYPHHLKDLGPGAVIGVDISIWLYKRLKEVTAARQFAISPLIPVIYAVLKTVNFAKNLVQHGIVPCFVFDGSNHLMKGGTDNIRERKRAAYEAKFAALEPRVQNAPQADKCFKGMAYPRQDFVSDVILSLKEHGFLVFGAAYEAEYQLVRMEEDGIIDAILTTDGDAKMAGCKTQIADIDEDSGYCTIIRRDEFLEHGAGGNSTLERLRDDTATSGFSALSSALGNDYLNRLEKAGRKGKIRTLFWREALEAAESFLNGGRINEDAVLCFGNRHYDADGNIAGAAWAQAYVSSAMLIRHHPVFAIIKKEGIDFDIADPDTYEIQLRPLNEFQGRQPSGEEWGDIIGFGKSPYHFGPMDGPTLLSKDDFKDAFLLNKLARFGGSPPERLPQPTLKIAPFYPVDHGAYINLDKVELWPKVHALKWLACCKQLIPRITHREAVVTIKKIIELEEADPQNAPRPRRFRPGASSSLNYQSQEVLEMRPTAWIKVSDSFHTNGATVLAKVC